MLKRACLAAIVLVLAVPAWALAQFGVDRDNEGSADVTVNANDSTTVAGGGSRPQPRACLRSNGTAVPCESDLGWWSNTYRCYLTMIQQAPPGDAEHAGEAFFRCDPGPAGWDFAVADPQLFLWLEAAAAGPDPRVLAFEAIDKMQLRAIDVGMAPPAGTAVLVNAPVWLWADNPTAATWGPATASATAGGVTVSATARVRQVEWSTGDGAEVVCGQGTPYAPGAEPSCSHTYRTPGTCSLAASTTWVVDWTSTTGVGGTETVDTTSTVSVEVREARALVTGRN